MQALRATGPTIRGVTGVTLTCARCRRPVPDGAAFCPSCGAAVGAALEIELDDAPTAGDGASEVVFERGPSRSRRAGAGAAAALAVAIGAAVASGGGGDRTAATTTTTRVVRATTTTAPPATTAAPAGPSTSAAPTTTTTIAVVGAGSPLLGEPVGATLLLTSVRGVVALDLDTGTAAPVDTGGRLVFAEDLLPVRGGFVGWSQGTVTVVRTDGGDRGEFGRTSGGGQLLGTDATGAAWLLQFENGPPALVRLVDASSPAQPVTLPLATTIYPFARPDGLGGLVQDAGGGVFRWEVGGTPVVLAEGLVVDAAGGFVLTQRCYPDPACTFTVTDVRGGAPRSLPVLAGDVVDATRLSPDGRWLVTNIATRGPEPADGPLVLREVTSGRTVELAVANGKALRSNGWMRSRLAWTADGRWLFYLSDGRTLRAWRDGLDSPIDIVLPDESLTGGVAVAVPA